MGLRIRLKFPEDLIQEPVVFTMATKFNVVPNIRRARVTETVGEMILELEGAPADVDKGIRFLRERGVEVTLIEGDVIE